MSNFIPMVSSSPPPIEDGQSFGWEGDEDDDDFGNFASAPGSGVIGSDHEETEMPGFDVNWSHVDSPAFQSGDKDLSPLVVSDRDASSLNPESAKNESALKENGKGSSYISDSVGSGSSSPSKSDTGPAEGSGATESDAGPGGDNDFNEDDDFADFAAFQDESSSKNKPQVGSLPLQKPDHQEKGAVENHEDSGEKTVESVMEKSRESTTDSGVFSTDISPLTKSESFSEGDRIVQSEDETFTELPQDTPQASSSPSVSGHSSSDAGSDAQNKQENCDVSIDSRSDTPRNEDTAEKGDEFPSKDERQDKENEMQEGSGASEQEETSVNKQKQEKCDSADRVEDCSNTENKTEVSDKAEVAAENSDDESPHSNSPVAIESEEGFSKSISGDEIVEENAEWAASETSQSSPSPPVPDIENSAHSDQVGEPEDLVLRTNSVEFDQDAVCTVDDDDDFGDFSTTVNDIKSSDIPSKLSSPDSGTPGNQTPDVESGDNDSGDFNKQSNIDQTIPGQGANEAETENKSEEIVECNNESNDDDFADFPATAAAQEKDETEDFGDFSANFNQSQKEEDDFGDFSSKENAQGDGEEDFGDSFTNKKSECTSKEDEFGDFSSKDASNEVDDDDDFGDFSAQPASSAAPAADSKTDNFAAFSAKPASGSEDDDDFGDFSSQSATAAAPSGDSGWANFAGPSSAEADVEESDDFGNFSDTKPAAAQDSTTTAQSGPDVAMALKSTFGKALSDCFPGYSAPTPLLAEEAENESASKEDKRATEPTDADKFGMLEIILKHGLRFRSASLQTWQVVQHPSKKDPRVRLWGHLKDVDGSQAVIYHFAKSHTNSLLFNTLSIDTQNMLIGHKKVAVPIFATGLSLLEPIRGGERDRSLGMGGPLPKGAVPSATTTTPTLVDPNQPNVEHPTQEIPAVDFDWSTSGLTNPLTSKSLDLDFLVVQDNDTSEKPSVFQSEILDAPRSSVKSTHPLEDILKSVKPTSVRSRRDNAATSQMSAEASRVLAGLPDLSFMHSKVLMFPIKN
ncbi:aftiphilin-like isoform X2 [Littorina saxatilis]|uniref:Aftiphilin clathrin-binding box domain-containing protein n=1 Tax=Littorina saxatilis TaxID=31220 RepID=A0AAN9BFZ5_9CAEN